jgi:hypothetical protein
VRTAEPSPGADEIGGQLCRGLCFKEFSRPGCEVLFEGSSRRALGVEDYVSSPRAAFSSGGQGGHTLILDQGQGPLSAELAEIYHRVVVNAHGFVASGLRAILQQGGGVPGQQDMYEEHGHWNTALQRAHVTLL